MYKICVASLLFLTAACGDGATADVRSTAPSALQVGVFLTSADADTVRDVPKGYMLVLRLSLEPTQRGNDWSIEVPSGIPKPYRQQIDDPDGKPFAVYSWHTSDEAFAVGKTYAINAYHRTGISPSRWPPLHFSVQMVER